MLTIGHVVMTLLGRRFQVWLGSTASPSERQTQVIRLLIGNTCAQGEALLTSVPGSETREDSRSA